MKREAPPPENHERWLVSYADFITLLFAFFVVMFASSQTDKSRAKQVSEAVEKALKGRQLFQRASAVAKILGGTVDDKGQGNAMMKGPGGAQHTSKESPPENLLELLPSLKRSEQGTGSGHQGGETGTPAGGPGSGDQPAGIGILSHRAAMLSIKALTPP